ncbi:MAG TPA: M23 family metallopeptidase [Clostridiaceae bacterium]|nr:M23 family metallopeptidase [Clostridiaceae bacterium]
MKKLFSDKKITKKSFLEFFDKKGFYIVLVLCIAIVGATAVFVTMNNPTSSEDDFGDEGLVLDESEYDYYADDIAEGLYEEELVGTPAAATEQEEVIEEAGSTETQPAEAKENESKGAVEKEEKKETETKTPDKTTQVASKTTTQEKPKSNDANSGDTKKDSTTTAKEQKFIMPVIGEITFDYARDKLVYSKTLEEWRTHDGIDIAAALGTPVKAVADGVVSEIKKDPRYGYTIIIDHQNGLKTVYANLASDEMVTPNQKVKQEEIIGSVGDTALFESAEQSHLHFEVLKDNVLVDPKAYLPIK